MNVDSDKKLPLWVFIVADVLFLVAAWWIMVYSPHPLPLGHVFALLICVGAGAWCALLPFLKTYETEHRLEEAASLKSSLEQIKQVETVARRIDETTRQWEVIHQETSKTVEAAQQVFDRMAAETKSFHDFLENSQQTQINHMKLETDKLRRSEQEWLQLCVHVLDHVYAITSAAIKSDNQHVARQLSQFRAAVYDSTRRVGLNPFIAEADEPFDSRKFQLKEAKQQPPEGSLIVDTIATGYTFQGQLLRRAMVEVKPGPVESEQAESEDVVRIIPPSLNETSNQPEESEEERGAFQSNEGDSTPNHAPPEEQQLF